MKIRSGGAELLRADRQTNRHTDRHDKANNQLFYIKRTSAHNIYSRVRLHVSTRG